MARLTITESIHASPQRTFELFSDFEHAAQNVKGIKRLEVLTEGPIGMGTRFRETRVMFGKEATETMEIIDWRPDGSTPSYTIGCGSCGARFESTFRFHPDDGGRSTKVEMDMTTTPLTLMAKLMSPLGKLMMGPMRKCIASDMSDLKQIAEATPQRT